MYPAETIRLVAALRAGGAEHTEIADLLSLPRSTIGAWEQRGFEALWTSPRRRRARSGCPSGCPVVAEVSARAYAYFLGQYLGDGSIVETPNGVFRCFVTCCAAYPHIVDECVQSMAAILPGNRVNRRPKQGAVDVNAYSKHWPCLVPQHGPGRKHERRIELVEWQRLIVLDAHPDAFVRGLIHSDGCRSMNTVRSPAGRRYSYPRYTFSNRSEDIRRLFAEACDRLGVAWRPMNACTVSVAQRASVATLDRIVGPKS